MPHASPFIATIVAALTFAYFGGLAARLLRLPNIAGYILAGVFLGPHTPGFVADQKLTADFAEIGVALLMFKVGLHFSVRDLLVVWHVVIPGALLQITASSVIGYAVGQWLGWSVGASAVLGLAIAISSTTVATKALETAQKLATEAGRITLGWLVVQDLVVILALVLLPVVGQQHTDTTALALITLKTVATFTAVTVALLSLGRWLLPPILAHTARLGSQELFTLGVIVIALGVAFGLSEFFGMSAALGAFFAGMVLGESDLSHQAAAESLPIQNIFTVLFFVSVGMLFDPLLFFAAYWEIFGLFAVIAVGCGLVFFALILALGSTPRDAGRCGGRIGTDRRIFLRADQPCRAIWTDDQASARRIAGRSDRLHAVASTDVDGLFGARQFSRPGAAPTEKAETLAACTGRHAQTGGPQRSYDYRWLWPRRQHRGLRVAARRTAIRDYRGTMAAFDRGARTWQHRRLWRRDAAAGVEGDASPPMHG